MAKILKYPATGKVVLEKEEAVIDNTRNNRCFYYCHSHEVATGQYECPYADLIDNTICCDVPCIFNTLGIQMGLDKNPYVETMDEYGNEIYLPQSYFNDVLDMNEEDYPF